MKVNSVSNTTFTSYVPVKIYAKDQYNPKFRRVYNNPDNNNFKRCQRQIISTLNGTIKEPNKEFVDFYKQYDKDYASAPAARSFYTGASGVYLVTGRDVDGLDISAKKIGRAKRESIEMTGRSNSYYSKAAVKDYLEDSNKYLKHFGTMLKNENKQPLILKVYFDAVRKKDNSVKSFKLLGANFEVDEN